MKTVIIAVLASILLTGCGNVNPLEPAVSLRESLLSAENCEFESIITADYDDIIHTFQMDCIFDRDGNLKFTVTDPETIQGITGNISAESAALTFDDKILAFPMIVEDRLTPVSAPWLFLKALRSGYINGCSREGDIYCIYIDDTFESSPLQFQVWLDADSTPLRSEIFYSGQKILSLDIRSFVLR